MRTLGNSRSVSPMRIRWADRKNQNDENGHRPHIHRRGYDDGRADGHRAEQSGVASLYLAEAWRSGWMPLTALAATTTHVRLGPYVLNA